MFGTLRFFRQPSFAAAGAQLAAGVRWGLRTYVAPVNAAMKKYKPITPGFRHRAVERRDELWKGGPFKQLTKGLNKTGGRNHDGVITSRRMGGGAKRLYRMVDFVRRDHINVAGVVRKLEYDPNRTAHIALIEYGATAPEGAERGPHSFAYVLRPDGMKVGDQLLNGASVPSTVGNCLELRNILPGTRIHNIELHPGKGGQLCRSAGTSAELLRVEDGFALLRLPSKDLRKVPDTCRATVGEVSNKAHMHRVLGKAGASRWMGRRPHVRGVAMNPVDHPHGGGTGKSTGGRTPKMNVFGKPAKWIPTRINKMKKNPLIVSDAGDKKRRGTGGGSKKQKKMRKEKPSSAGRTAAKKE